MTETHNTETLTATEKPNGPVPITRLISLRLKKLSYEQIGKIVGRAKETVWERLQPYKDAIDGLQDFKDQKADILAIQQAEIINSLTPEDIKQTPAVQRATMFGIFYDKERLERDLSTSNVAHDVLIVTADDKRKAYEAAVKARIEAEGNHE